MRTIENSFKRILKEGAESAVREASLDLLRKCYVSIAAGSKLSDLVEAIKKIKPGGGSDGGDPTDGTARMP